MKNIRNILEGTRFEKPYACFLFALSATRAAVVTTADISDFHVNEACSVRAVDVFRDSAREVAGGTAKGYKDSVVVNAKVNRHVDVYTREQGDRY